MAHTQPLLELKTRPSFCTEASLLNKGSCLARALCVTKFINMRDVIFVALVVLLKSHSDDQQTHLC